MTPDPYLIYVDAAGHLAPVSSTASSGTAVIGPAELGTSTPQPESGFHTPYKVVSTPEPAAARYGTVGHNDYLAFSIEITVAGLCVFTSARRRSSD
jgi:hypothetical protein